MRQTARTAGSVAVLALLVCACVFAALTGPAVSLRTRTQALSQTLAAASPIIKTVQVEASWDQFTSAVSNGSLGYLGVGESANLTPAQQVQMESILNDCWLYYRTVLSDSKSRVEQILNAEQRKKFEHLLQEYQPR